MKVVLSVPQLVDLKNLTKSDLTAFLAGIGKERFRAGQIMRWIYPRGVCDFAAMTDLSKELRSELVARAFVSDWTPEHVAVSSDGTRKYLFRLADGETIETVRIPMLEGRSTLCISTQVGCAMQCSFCLTGAFGLTRNLEVNEIVNQVCAAQKEGPIQNIVLMGMGEPLHNLENVIKAIEILGAVDGFAFGPRKITISTSGLVPEMAEFGRRVKVNLAVSLNATTDAVRDLLMPVNRRYPLPELLTTCARYTQRTKRIVTFEYTLVRGINDSDDQARELANRLKAFPARVNLIPLSPVSGFDGQPSAPGVAEHFLAALGQAGINATLRNSQGRRIQAACGQLRLRHLE